MHEQYLHHFGMALLGCQEDGRGAILQAAWGNVVFTAVRGAEDVQKVGMSWRPAMCQLAPAHQAPSPKQHTQQGVSLQIGSDL